MMRLLGFTVTDAASLAATVLSPKEALKLAGMSGPPHQVLRSAYRLRSAAAAIYTRHGLAGFYTGILPNVMQVNPASFLLSKPLVGASCGRCFAMLCGQRFLYDLRGCMFHS